MYWVDRGPDARPRYEVMDGQQRTISVCSYVAGQYSLDGRFFFNLPRDVKERILGYPLTVYVCSGTESEKLDWFRIVNIAGVQLNDQELLNAVYAGPWVTDARARFSKPGGPAVQVGGDWLKGSAIRQDYLATVLGWAAARHGASVEDYMGTHQHDPTAQALWSYFRSVLDWAQAVFPVYRREMKGLPWGPMYDANRDRTDLDPNALEARVQELMADEDVTRKSGVYRYLLDGDERRLSIRAFDKRTQRAAYETQGHRCAVCGGEFGLADMHADHIVPWSRGGHTVPDNCQMLCRDCNLKKGAQA